MDEATLKMFSFFFDWLVGWLVGWLAGSDT